MYFMTKCNNNDNLLTGKIFDKIKIKLQDN